MFLTIFKLVPPSAPLPKAPTGTNSKIRLRHRCNMTISKTSAGGDHGCLIPHRAFLRWQTRRGNAFKFISGACEILPFLPRVLQSLSGQNGRENCVCFVGVVPNAASPCCTKAEAEQTPLPRAGKPRYRKMNQLTQCHTHKCQREGEIAAFPSRFVALCRERSRSGYPGTAHGDSDIPVHTITAVLQKYAMSPS